MNRAFNTILGVSLVVSGIGLALVRNTEADEPPPVTRTRPVDRLADVPEDRTPPPARTPLTDAAKP